MRGQYQLLPLLIILSCAAADIGTSHKNKTTPSPKQEIPEVSNNRAQVKEEQTIKDFITCLGLIILIIVVGVAILCCNFQYIEKQKHGGNKLTV
ncbi:hypothetical protein TcasGA2_TC033033 [Tribolium castaneum]|uniref:Uncharacterized protein n=1 Tax=Tribolium castaneum TaxID=7070 RepID=A0A139WHW6_TRICA|nr:hypothetical protein TcasGA2_TC033033 [Tribolium castaneum]